ncbi:MAG: tetratricopeptide repeat domain containing protein [Caulobacteraceae bacterium]|nr:MAG: tetratricopeptide repeat domain containing protein [Caulobacteraceae bacterium]
MDWLRQAAAQLREWLMQQAWLDAWQSSIAQTPDWALLVAGPTTLLAFALLLRITWPGSRTSDADTKPKVPQAQRQSRQPASANVAPPLAPTRKPAAVQPAALRAPGQMADDDEGNRSVRVFVSSTFLDMQTERNELVTKTFPALRAKYRARGVELFEVDLRWGITREQQERGETLPTLLAEIDRCRPYFIGLLGDRYGWVPPAAALTDKLKADYPVLAEAQGTSVTALEIMHGVLSDPETAARACFFERDPNWNWRATLNDADRAAATAEPEAARAKLGDLKAYIGRTSRVEAYARPAEIGPKVAAALDALLEARFPEADAPGAFEQTARLHRAYARERRRLHVGADGYMRDLNRWMETKDAAPLLITGASGSGKSTLVANWINAWRKAHPSHIVFEHYLGASPDSADPMQIMRRLWEHLNHATGESVALPGDGAELMDVSAALAQRLAQARVSAKRSGSRMLIALDGLDKLSSEQNLRWLPIAPGVHWLASSLPSEAETAARARGFEPLDVKPLVEQERRDLIAGTLKRWRRKLEPQHIARILQPAAAELAGSPLYLKTVLEELRVSADNARLAERLEDYSEARDMADLFDRVLKRLEGDCEPGFVAKVLPLIWASRVGLEETEILAITDASPLVWATLRNGLGDGLRDHQGRMAFGHDFLNQAVGGRYINSDEGKRLAHLSLADYFEMRPPDERQAEELPYQLRAGEAWDRLEALLLDLDHFHLLHAGSDSALWSYWLPLKERGRDPERLLCHAFALRCGEAERWSVEENKLASALADFLKFTGASGQPSVQLAENRVASLRRLFAFDAITAVASIHLASLLEQSGRLEEAEEIYRDALDTMERGIAEPDNEAVAFALSHLAALLTRTDQFAEAEPLLRRALAIGEKIFGPEHEKVAAHLNDLAVLCGDTNRHAEAERLLKRALAIDEKTFGPENPKVATVLNNLATLYLATNRDGEAEPLLRRALAIDEKAFGSQHPQVATDLNNLAVCLVQTQRFNEAELILRRVLKIWQLSFGSIHSNVAAAYDNLAELLSSTDRFAEAEPLYRQALETYEKTFGANHPKVALRLNHLAQLLCKLDRHTEAEPLLRRVLAIDEELYGTDHPDVAGDLNNLAALLMDTNRLAEAEPLLRRALDIAEKGLALDDIDVAMGLNNLATLLRATGRLAEAEPLLRRALKIDEESFGPDHPNVAIRLNNLAVLLVTTNRHAEAEPLCRRSFAIMKASFGADHPQAQTTAQILEACVRALKA